MIIFYNTRISTGQLARFGVGRRCSDRFCFPCKGASWLPCGGRNRALQYQLVAEALGKGTQLQSLSLAIIAYFGLAVSPTEWNAIPPAVALSAMLQEERQTIRLFKENTPSVVYITNLTLRKDTFTTNTMEIPQGAGSGFILKSEFSQEPVVVTNYHVVRGASDLTVTLNGGKQVSAKVVGADIDKDIAVLKLLDPVAMLLPVTVGSSGSDALQVGQFAYAIGNPFGLDHTLTTGVVSGLGREIMSFSGKPIEGIIQTDCAINPGNSGGPLLNSKGETIGMNTAIFSSSGTSSGVGFAIPIDTIVASVDQILQFGKVVRPIIGITFAPEPAVEQLGITGILVLNTKPGSPAELAGIHGTERDSYGRLVLGDIITAVNGAETKTSSDLFRILNKCNVGDKLDLEILRGDTKVHTEIELASSDTKEQ